MKIINFIILIALLSVTKNSNLKQSFYCDGGMKFDGFCINTKENLNFNTIPPAVQDTWNSYIAPLLKKVNSDPSICAGDFSTDSLSTNADLTRGYCHKLPLDSNMKYGTFALSAKNVACGLPLEINMCFVFDQCGTVALSLNGGSLACFASATGIGSALSTVSDVVKSIQFGFSLQKKFGKDVVFSYPEGNVVQDKSITVKGHFYFGLSVGFPKKWLQVGGIDLSKFVNISGEMSQLIDFGNVESTTSKMVQQISNANKDSVSDILNSILSSGSETAFIVDGNVTFNLDAMTSGFLTDLSFNVNVAMFASLGGGSSGVTAGFYLKITTDALTKLLDMVREVYGHFSTVLNLLDVPTPDFIELGDAKIDFGLYIQPGQAGFNFKCLGIDAYCIFRFEGNGSGSCNFGSKFFTALTEGGKWVIKEAKTFFDDTGKTVIEIAKGAGKFAEDAARQVKEAAEAAAQKIREAAEEVARKAKEAAEEAAQKAREIAEAAAQKAREEAELIAQKAREEAEILAQRLKEEAEAAAQRARDEAERLAQTIREEAEALAQRLRQEAQLLEDIARNAANLARHEAEAAANKAKQIADDIANKAKKIADEIKKKLWPW